ncbi:MAG: hypothetical protein LBQ20_03940 [Rhodanobacter sp.]|jgi:hypothetical protein|nr:hypothetical protein [Rhodanobacter sp.]
MSLRLAKLLLLCLFPIMGAAQTLPALVPAKKPLVDQLLAIDQAGRSLPAQATPVLPIWSGVNGQLLAIVALPRGWSVPGVGALPVGGGASAWQLATSPVSSAGSGLRWQNGGGLYVNAILNGSLATLPTSCTPSACDRMPWSRSALAGSLAMGWVPAGSVDLSYGLSWMRAQGDAPTLGTLALSGSPIPVLTLPGALMLTPDGETAVFARGRWQFGQGSALDIGASYGRSRLSPVGILGSTLGSSTVDLDKLSLSLGLDAGSLRGAIVGHVLSSDDPVLAGKHWTTLDLGVSWRTPWSGELSVGAQNLWSAPNSPRDVVDTSQARTPYIRYRQDL